MDASSSLFSSGSLFAQEENTQSVRTTTAKGSILSAGNDVNIKAGQQPTDPANQASSDGGKAINIIGSTVVATKEVNLNSDGDINISSAQGNVHEQNEQRKGKSGIFTNGGFSITLGSQKEIHTTDTQQVIQYSSTIGSLDGDININAANDVTVNASDLLARTGDINIEGDNVHLNSADDTLKHTEEHIFKQSGLTLALTGGVVDTINTVTQAAEKISTSKDDRLQALQAWRIGRTVEGTDITGQVDSLDHIGNDFANPTEATKEGDPSSGINLSLSLGSSKSETTRQLDQRTAFGSSVLAEGDVNISAKTDAQRSDSGDITLTGALVEGDNINLDADRNITLQSAENQLTDNEQTKSNSTGIGISIGSDGLLFNVNASKSRGLVNQSDDQYLETQLNANKRANLTSGNDTTLEGAQVNAEQITANVGNNLSITSQQDTSEYKNRQKSLGISASIGYGKWSGSLNYSDLKADSIYQSVQEQSGLFAGEEGFDVNVQNNTALNAGAIVSEADKTQNSLSTDTLSHNSLQNSAEYKVESKSISFSSKGSNSPTKGFGGGFSNDDGSAENTTFAALSDAELEIRSNPAQADNLNPDIKRSKEQAHTTLNRIFSEDKIQQIQEEVEISQILSQEGTKAVGDYATSKLNEANELRQAANNAEGYLKEQLLNEAQQIENNWQEGGQYRVALHSVIGGLANGIDGIVGSALTATVIPELDSLLQAEGVSEDARAAILLVSSAGIGKTLGGDNGLFQSVGQTTNNYLNHTEATRLNALNKQLIECTDNCNNQTELLNEIKALKELDQARNEYAATVCSLPSSVACGQVIDELSEFREEYQTAGLSSSITVKSESLEVLEKLDQYRQRANNPDLYNIVKGTARSVGEGIEGSVQLGVVAGKAVTGDEASQALLGEMAVAAKEFLSDPIDNTQKAIVATLEQADQLEKEGRTDEAKQLRANLFASGVFTITGTGGLVISGTKAVVAGTKQLAEKVTDASKSLDGKGLEVASVVDKGTIQEGVTDNVTQPWKYENRTDVIKRTADDVNSVDFDDGYKPPYKSGTQVTEFTVKLDDKFVRVHGEDNAARPWMMRKEAIEGLTAEQIQRKYSLPSKPQFVSDVDVPAGTRMRTGQVESNFELQGGGGSGATQYEWLDTRVPPTVISNTREID